MTVCVKLHLIGCALLASLDHRCGCAVRNSAFRENVIVVDVRMPITEESLGICWRIKDAQRNECADNEQDNDSNDNGQTFEDCFQHGYPASFQG